MDVRQYKIQASASNFFFIVRWHELKIKNNLLWNKSLKHILKG
jgi:hypothetical protein